MRTVYGIGVSRNNNTLKIQRSIVVSESEKGRVFVEVIDSINDRLGMSDVHNCAQLLAVYSMLHYSSPQG